MWREIEGCTVSMFPGFMYAEFKCPACGYEWVGVSSVGMTGIACPACGLRDLDFVWRAPKEHFSRSMPHDGCWLTGQFVPVELQENDEEPDVLDREPVRVSLAGRFLFVVLGLIVTLINRVK